MVPQNVPWLLGVARKSRGGCTYLSAHNNAVKLNISNRGQLKVSVDFKNTESLKAFLRGINHAINAWHPSSQGDFFESTAHGVDTMETRGANFILKYYHLCRFHGIHSLEHVIHVTK